MFIVAPFIDSTDLAIVAEADLRCGDFLSGKVVVTVLAVSLSFGLDYQKFLEFSQI